MKAEHLDSFIEIELQQVPTESTLQNELFIHLPQNDRMICLVKKGDALTEKNKMNLLNKGTQKVYLLKEDTEAFLNWIETVTGGQMTEPSEQEPTSIPTSLPNPEELPLSAAETQQAIYKAIDLVFPKLSDLVRSIFSLHGNFLSRSHGVHVALYSCLISIAFKKAEPKMISVLTLASLFHDVGIARLPIQSVRELEHHQDPAPAEYQKHVNLGADWIKNLIEGLDNEVIDVIRSHHERFDGQGYPNQQKGFDLINLSQILAMADTLDHLCTGSWDGKKYSIIEAIEVFNQLEPDPIRPKYFLPEIYSKAQALLKSPELASSLISAEERLKEYSASLKT